MKRDDRKEVREGALTICASGEQYKDQPPPGPLVPIIRIEQVDTPVYTGRNERSTRRTFQLSATVNTLDELDVLLAKMRAELLAAEITPTDIGKLTVIHREKSLLRPPRRGECPPQSTDWVLYYVWVNVDDKPLLVPHRIARMGTK